MWAMLVGLVWAGEPPAVMTLGAPSGPPGITTAWTLEGCNIRLRLENGTGTPVEVDWMRSVYGPKGGAAVALVPGTSSKLSSMISIPPMVVPPGSYAEELLFRKDRMPGDGGGCLVDVPSDATITLNVGGGWLVQPLSIGFDIETMRGQEAAMAAAAAKREADAAVARDALAVEARRYPTLDLRVGQVCFQGPAVAELCIASTGETRDVALAAPGNRMRVVGCSASTVDSGVGAWKRWRKVGNWLVPWFYSTPLAPAAWGIAGSVARKAEDAYATCMAGR